MRTVCTLESSKYRERAWRNVSVLHLMSFPTAAPRNGPGQEQDVEEKTVSRVQVDSAQFGDLVEGGRTVCHSLEGGYIHGDTRGAAAAACPG